MTLRGNFLKKRCFSISSFLLPAVTQNVFTLFAATVYHIIPSVTNKFCLYRYNTILPPIVANFNYFLVTFSKYLKDKAEFATVFAF